MDMRIWTAILTLIGQIIAFLIYRHSTVKDKDQIDIELIKEFKVQNPSIYLVENLFFKRYKCIHITFDDIKALLLHPMPRQAIRRYVAVNKRINVFHLKIINNTLHGTYTTPFSTTKKKIKKIIINIILASLFYSASVYLLIKLAQEAAFIHSLFINGKILEYMPMITGMLFISCMFLLITFLCVLDAISIFLSENNRNKILFDFNSSTAFTNENKFLEKWISD
ncbi:hypothetical protein ACL2XP_18130 [Sodalis sp. RH21]|uniref:hypothetical protein n=1 Tax=unclassified Sodalis (in: enterobacteria) TaxID=2636512 RepID=UPI0039B4BFF5